MMFATATARVLSYTMNPPPSCQILLSLAAVHLSIIPPGKP